MATSTATQHTPSKHSPQRRPDPFLALPITPVPSPPGSPPLHPHETTAHEGPKQAFLTKILLTPLLMTSFILSLLYTSARDRAQRASNSPSSTPSSFLSYFSPFSWWAAEPYQDPVDSTWNVDGAAQGGQSGKWFIRKKHRKMAKLQLGDALEGTGPMMLGICAVIAIGAVLFGGTAWMLWARWTG